MTPLSGRLAGMATLSVELEQTDPDRILIRIRTVDDVLGGAAGDERPFGDAQAAISYLAAWLENWAPTTVITAEER